MNQRIVLIALISLTGLLGTGSVFATQLVYHPVNPAFGGNPQNGPSLLSEAQAQGEGVKSGSQGPDLSGLNSALGNLGAGAVVIGGTGTGTGTGGSSTGKSGTSSAVTP